MKSSLYVRNGNVFLKNREDFIIVKHMFYAIDKVFWSTLINKFLVNCFFSEHFDEI